MDDWRGSDCAPSGAPAALSCGDPHRFALRRRLLLRIFIVPIVRIILDPLGRQPVQHDAQYRVLPVQQRADTGSGAYDPSEETPYAGSVAGTASLTVGAQAYAYANIPYYSATATGSVSTGVSASARLYTGNIQDQFTWGGLTIAGQVLVYHDINNPYVNQQFSSNVLNSSQTNWYTLYTIPTS